MNTAMRPNVASDDDTAGIEVLGSRVSNPIRNFLVKLIRNTASNVVGLETVYLY